MIIAIFGLAPVLIHPAAASEPTTETAEAQRYQLEIRRTTLSAALKDLARQTSLQFARFSDIAPKALIVGPLSGMYTRAQALDLLLHGTGLTYRFVNERTVAIVAIVTSAPSSSKHSTPRPPPIKSSPPSAAPSVAPAAPESNSKSREPKSVSKKTGLLGRIAGFFALCGPLLAAGPAYCQNAAPDTSTDTLQEVVVTAERRAENVQTTPISVVAVSGADLQAQSVATVNDLQTVAPDVSIQSGNGSSTINVRGIGIEPVGIAEAGVSVVRDGIVDFTPGSGLDMPFYDMADVEVLRGPQGTFSGDNSTGGAVIINSQNPNFRGVNGYVMAKVATYSDTGLQGAVNLPVNDTLAMRLAFNEEERGSFYYDEGSSMSGPNLDGPLFIPTTPTCTERLCASSGTTNKTAIDPGNLNNKDMRLGLLWKPTDNFQMLTKVEIDNSDTDGLPTQPNINTFAPLGPGLPCPANHGTAPNCQGTYVSGYSGNPRVLNSPLQAQEYNEHDTLYSENMQYTLPNGTVVRFVGGDQEVGDYTQSSATADSIDVQNGFPNTSITTYHNYGGELDVLSPTTGKLSWIAGGVIERSAEELGAFSVSTAFPYSVASPEYSCDCDGYYVTYNGWGAFGQLTYQITPALQFQVGGRLGWDIEQGYGAVEIAQGENPTKVLVMFPTDVTRREDRAVEDNWYPSGKIGFNWNPVAGQYFYAFWAHGYKPGLSNFNGPSINKEWVNDSEVGWKGTLASGHVQTQVGAYYMNYYEMQEQTFDPYNPRSSNDSNLAPSTVEGLEAAMQSKFGHLGFNISLDVNKSKLGSVITAKTYAFPTGYGLTKQCSPAQIAAGAPITVCTDYSPFLESLAGEQLPFSPLFQGTATLEYDIPLGSTSLEPRVTYAFTDTQYANLIQIPVFEEPAHGLVNAYLDWTAGPWTTTVFATNVTNKLYVTSITGTSEYYGAPRQVGLQVNRTF